MQCESELQQVYAQINAAFFGNELPSCRLKWSRQLTRAAGNIDVKNRVIKLSVPLLSDAFEAKPGSVLRGYEICGIFCDSQAVALREILKHEMIHLWLHERGMPSGHTAQFRLKARQIGQPKTRHGIARPLPKSGWIYSCSCCSAQIMRRKRFSRPVACAACCKTHNGGAFDVRFRLKGRKIVAVPD